MPDAQPAPPWTEEDQRFMQVALALAARGDYRTGANPKVGAVIVRDGELLGQGFHQESGGPHAEALALAELRGRGKDAAGATLYVTLEPCGPFPGKRTPPCVEAVLAAGLARVVVAQADPHPHVAGRSLERLRQAGLDVTSGLYEDQARRLNGPFAKWVTRGLPYVTAKWAMSLDGRIATRTGDSRWISGEASRRCVHTLRGEVDAIAVGIGTALADDPQLTRRGVPGRDPLRVVLDSRARLPLGSSLVRTARDLPVLVVVGQEAPLERVKALEEAGVEVASLEGGPRLPLAPLLPLLAEREVRHLLLEGGGEVLAACLEADLVDRILCFLAPVVVGGEGAPGPVRGLGSERIADALRLGPLESTPCGQDVLLEGHVHLY